MKRFFRSAFPLVANGFNCDVLRGIVSGIDFGTTNCFKIQRCFRSSFQRGANTFNYDAIQLSSVVGIDFGATKTCLKIQHRFRSASPDVVKRIDKDDMLGPVIGIDLGTKSSCVAIMKGKHAKVIKNEEGSLSTPSVVAFTNDGQCLVGTPAIRQAATNSQNTIYGIKHLIGRRFDDPVVQNQMKVVPFKIIKANNGDALVEVFGKPYSPSHIISLVIKKLKKTAENYLGRNVPNAVITVPASFNESQRRATKAAGQEAGLRVLGILDEPVAAAMSFDFKVFDEKYLAVCDLEESTLSILKIYRGDFTILSRTKIPFCDDFNKLPNDFFIPNISQVSELILFGENRKNNVGNLLTINMQPNNSIHSSYMVASGAAFFGKTIQAYSPQNSLKMASKYLNDWNQLNYPTFSDLIWHACVEAIKNFVFENYKIDLATHNAIRAFMQFCFGYVDKDLHSFFKRTEFCHKNRYKIHLSREEIREIYTKTVFFLLKIYILLIKKKSGMIYNQFFREK